MTLSYLSLHVSKHYQHSGAYFCVLLSLAKSNECLSDCCLTPSEQCVQQHQRENNRATFDKAMVISVL